MMVWSVSGIVNGDVNDESVVGEDELDVRLTLGRHQGRGHRGQGHTEMDR